MRYLAIILLAIFTIIFVTGIFQEVFAFEFPETFEEESFLLACPNGECHKVYYASMDRQDMIDFCVLGDEINACHREIYMDDQSTHYVAFEKGKEFDKALSGCTWFDHEIYHAWGFNEAMIPQFFPCDRQPLFNSIPHLGFWK